MKFALAGNPNCGKTTLFNTLTGSTAHVGNWPGVTVDKREGVYKKLGEKVDIVDLPGIYSLSPYSPEEVISRNYIVDEKPDCIINVVDATNLERNLYLTTQLLEIDVPVVIALNMMDLVRQNKTTILKNEIEEKLGVPVVEISALKKEGIEALMKKAYETSKTPRVGKTVIENKELTNLFDNVKKEFETKVSSPLFHAIKLVENDSIEVESHKEVLSDVSTLKAQVSGNEFEGDFEAMIADARYKYISKYFSKAIVKKTSAETMTKSDKIDKVLTHRFWSIPIFLVIMFVVFHFVFSEDLLFLNSIFGLTIKSEWWINFFTGMGYDGLVEEAKAAEEVFQGLEGIPSLGVFLQSWMGWLTGSIMDLFSSFMPEGTWYTGLIVDGLLGGLDAIFSFIPQVLLLFLFISILEDSGYMARVAFIMDRAFRKFGLSGKAFIPLLMGFGCSVPAMMATKTLEDERERDMTIRITPFFSCGAKAPIWTMLAAVVAGKFLGDVFVFSIYLFGIVVAIVAAIIMKLFSKNYDVPPFIMELPAYHRPQFKNLMAHLWDKFKHFLYKASTIITASIILIWFLSNFKWALWQGMVEMEDSMLADLGHILKYVFYPLGWAQGDDGWKYSVASITGLIAKEDVVTTMENLGLVQGAINLTNAQIYSFAVYNLFTLPCFAAVATAKSESSKKGFYVTLAWWLLASYVISLVVYWIGALLEASVILGILLIVVLIVAIVFLGYYVAKKRKAQVA
ncbi:MAG: ferrous iron transporter B [Acholeplasmataceae bacterium]|nr:ferrous iron transporter B [Acholeplasmataceae bacterium]